MEPWMLFVAGVALPALAWLASMFFTARFRGEQGPIVTAFELNARRGTVVPPWVSLVYLVGLGTAIGGVIWLVIS